MIFDASTLTLVSFIYLRLLDKMLQMIKVKLLQSFEDFYVANSIQIYFIWQYKKSLATLQYLTN